MKDIVALRENEKIKRMSTLLGAGGVALLLAALIRWTDRVFDLPVGVWILLSGGAIFSSVAINDLLVSEELE